VSTLAISRCGEALADAERVLREHLSGIGVPLAQHRRELAARATGKVLDLGGWFDHLDAYTVAQSVGVVGTPPPSLAVSTPLWFRDLPVDQLDSLDALGEAAPYDTIVSLVRLPLVVDASLWLARLATLLAPGGRLFFLEPTRSVRSRTELVLDRVRHAQPRPAGLRLERDVPALMRAVRPVGELRRFELDPTVPALRWWVSGIAYDLTTTPVSTLEEQLHDDR
jgi:hypothetical protein